MLKITTALTITLLMASTGVLAVAEADPPGFPGFGKGGEAPDPASLVTVKAASDVETIAPGQSFHIAVTFDIAKHWHIYWKSPGSSGAPTEVRVAAPEGFVVGSPLFPRPAVFHGIEGTTYGYAEKAVLFVPIKAPPRLDASDYTFEVDANWLVCREVCHMGDATATVRISASEQAGGAVADRTIAEFAKRLPMKITGKTNIDVRYTGMMLVISGHAGASGAAGFLPIETPGVTFGQALTQRRGDRFHVRVPVEIKPQNARGAEIVLEGLLTEGQRVSDPSWIIQVPVQDAATPAPSLETRP